MFCVKSLFLVHWHLLLANMWVFRTKRVDVPRWSLRLQTNCKAKRIILVANLQTVIPSSPSAAFVQLHSLCFFFLFQPPCSLKGPINVLPITDSYVITGTLKRLAVSDPYAGRITPARNGGKRDRVWEKFENKITLGLAGFWNSDRIESLAALTASFAKAKAFRDKFSMALINRQPSLATPASRIWQQST